MTSPARAFTSIDAEASPTPRPTVQDSRIKAGQIKASQIKASQIKASQIKDSRIQSPGTAPGMSPGFHLSYLAGRLTELSGASSLSLTMSLVQHAQQRLEPVAWITASRSLFFPPDAAECGVLLDVLPIIQLTSVKDAARAADHLLRSGAFGLVVLDLGKNPRIPPALSTRLQGLARRHDAAVLFLTRKPPSAESISPLVTIRAQAWRKPLGENRFACGLEIQKDKRHGSGWVHEERRRGATGIC